MRFTLQPSGPLNQDFRHGIPVGFPVRTRLIGMVEREYAGDQRIGPRYQLLKHIGD